MKDPTQSPEQDDIDRLWQTQETPKMDIPFDTIMNDASRFQRSVRHRNAREYVAGVVVLAVFGWLAVSPRESLLARVAAMLLVIGIVVMMTHIRLRGHAADALPQPSISTRDMLRWHRRELERQRDLLKRAPVWGFGPILPGTVLFVIAATLRTERPIMTVFVVVAILTILAFCVVINLRGVSKLDARIAALPRDDDDGA